MAGHTPFSNLTKKLSPEARARVAAKAARLREEVTPEELRQTRSLSQKKRPAK
jgi:hypothetical protein